MKAWIGHVDLVCQGETDESWLFHGGEGSPIEHLAIPKTAVPYRVEWVHVQLVIHGERDETQGDTSGSSQAQGIQGDTPGDSHTDTQGVG